MGLGRRPTSLSIDGRSMVMRKIKSAGGSPDFMTYFALMWDPGADTSWPELVGEWLAGPSAPGQRTSRWSCGVSRSLKLGDNAILIRTTQKPTGVVAIGNIVRASYKDGHWNADSPRSEADFVEVEWEIVATEPIVGKEDHSWAHLSAVWRLQSGGTRISDADGDEIFQFVRQSDFWSFVPATAQLIEHWKQHPPTDSQQQMLAIHYWSPDSDMPPEYLGQAMGWVGMPAANLHYGAFASQTATALNVIYADNSDKISLFSALPRDAVGRVTWRMHNQVREAIEHFGWQVGGGAPATNSDTERLLFAEGKWSERTIKYQERNATLRAHCLSVHPLNCKICGFEPGNSGSQFASMLEVHHTNPLAAAVAERFIDPKESCILLCATCHRFAHHGMRVGTCRDEPTIKKLMSGSG